MMHPEYRQHWIEAGYNPDIGSAGVTKPPPPPFVRVYYLTPEEWAISNIALSRIKLSRFSMLNDPFELIAANFKNRDIENKVLAWKHDHNDKFGLLCFSRDWTNPVLWSHYAARHHGICLGFDVHEHLLRDVSYREERMVGEFEDAIADGHLTDAMKSTLLTTKFEHWQYEGERRMFVPLEDTTQEGAFHFYPFSEHLRLSEVILGLHCRVHVDTVRSLVQALYSNAVVFKARLAYKFYKVVPDEKTVP